MRSPAIAYTALVLTLCGFAPAQAGPQLWLSGDDPVVQAQKHKQTPADYMDLFRPDSAWSHDLRDRHRAFSPARDRGLLYADRICGQ
jgi:hypothetical protein